MDSVTELYLTVNNYLPGGDTGDPDLATVQVRGSGVQSDSSFNLQQQKQACKSCQSVKTCVRKHYLREFHEFFGGPCPSYLELYAESGGGAVSLEDELERSGTCGRTAIELEGGGISFFKRVRCKKVWCPVCGGKGGVLHQERFAAAYRRVADILSSRMLRYLVFTVPEQYRHMFLSRKILNGWYKGIRKLMRSVFPGEDETILSAHYEGERNIGKWSPHMNFLSFIQRGLGVVSTELLSDIKERYARMLTGLLGLDHVPDVDIHYSFAVQRGQMLNRVKYSLRPMGEDEFRAFPDEVQRFLAVDLKGFQHVRYGESLKGEKNKQLLSQYRDASEVAGGAVMLSPVDGVTPLRVVGFVSAERMRMMESIYTKVEYPGDIVRYISPLESDDGPF